MLSKEDNELMCRVGRGTAMGDLLRQSWMPFRPSTELPEPDCPPRKVRLLGEDLVAFRDTRGEVGLIAANCPHRGASLFFGRNEECGLRCVYHGWKFDTSGACVDTPTEPARRANEGAAAGAGPTPWPRAVDEAAAEGAGDKVRAVAYPCQERGGMAWTYMGQPEHMRGPPELEWTHVPASHRYITKRIQRCNFLQNVEGEVDSSHVSFLHSRARQTGLPDYIARDRSPRFF